MVKLSGKSGKILSGVVASSTVSVCTAGALGNTVASNSAGQSTGAEFISKLGKFVGNHWGKILLIGGLAGFVYFLYKQNFFELVKMFISSSSKEGTNIIEDTSSRIFLSKKTVFEIEKLNKKVSYEQADPEALVDYKSQQVNLDAIMNDGQNLGGNSDIAPEISSDTGKYKHVILSFDGKNGVASCLYDGVIDRFSISDDANIVAFNRHSGGNKFYFVNEDKYYSLGKGKEEVKKFEKEAKEKGLTFKKSHDRELCLIEDPKQSSSGPSSTAYERFSGLVTLLKGYHKIGPGVNKAEKNPHARGVYYEDNSGSFIRNTLDLNYYKSCGFKDPHTGEFLSCNYKLSNDGKGNIIEEIVFAPEDFEEIKFILHQDKWYKIERHSKMRDGGLNEWVDDRTTPFDGDDPWCKKAQAAFDVIKRLDPAVNGQNINNNLNNNFGNNGNLNGFVPMN